MNGHFQKDTSEMGQPVTMTAKDLVCAAHVLFNYGGYVTYEQIETETGIPATTVWRWMNSCFNVSYSFRTLKPSLTTEQMEDR
eukprot:UN25962